MLVSGDPTVWTLAQPVAASPLSQLGDVVQIAVAGPLTGSLLLSGRSAASVVVFNPSPLDQPSGGGEVIPSGVEPATPAIYLPSSTGPALGATLYGLPSITNLTTLGNNIAAAMSAGSSLTIDYGTAAVGGVLTLNGATLPFVVLCPMTPSADGPKAVP
jgi:hypothetical protein